MPGYATTLRNSRLDAITTRAGNAALLRFYDGTRPATGGTATTLLAELTCGTPFAAGASSGVLTAGTITQDSSANASGTATWARLVQSDGTTHVADFSVGVQASTTVSGTSGAATVTVGSNSGIAISDVAAGTGIATGARVVNINGTTVTLDTNNTGTVSGTGTFSKEINLVTTTIVATQPVSISSLTITEPNA